MLISSDMVIFKASLEAFLSCPKVVGKVATLAGAVKAAALATPVTSPVTVILVESTFKPVRFKPLRATWTLAAVLSVAAVPKVIVIVSPAIAAVASPAAPLDA